MRKIAFALCSFILMAALAACGNTDKAGDTAGTENTSQNTNTENDNSTNNSKNTNHGNDSNEQQDMKAQMDKLDFYEIEVEVSYGKNNEYEAEIEQDKNQPIEAKVEDELNNEFLKGKEAFDSIYSKAKDLSLSKDSSDEETIDQILKAFNLKNDYEKFEVEITFNDDSKLDVEDRKIK